MMDGRNSAGHTISLLNDSGDVIGFPSSTTTTAASRNNIHLPPLSASSPHQQYQHHYQHHHRHQSLHHQPQELHHHHHHSHSSDSSCATTPLGSPHTPLLVRSTSSDSRAFSTPSPLTPAANSFDPAGPGPLVTATGPSKSSGPRPSSQHYYLHQHPAHAAKMDDPNVVALYPPIPDGSLPMPSVYQLPPQLTPQMSPQLPMQPMHVTDSSNSPVSEPSRVSNVSAASAGNAGSSAKKTAPKKNQYPCPMAKQVGCTDFFTTSGHAARHAKKHTGKKDAFCPECNKAFTRKDNMEQHRRTHQNGRGTTRSGTTTDDAKVKKSTKPPAKKVSLAKVEPQHLEAAVEQQLERQQQQVTMPTPQMSVPLAPNLGQIAPPMQAPLGVDQNLMMQPSGPYFLHSIDSGPIPPLPNIVPDLHMRPTLHRSSFANSLDYVPPVGPLMGDGLDSLHFSYPSPGLSNGLNSLALASEHRRLSEEKARESPSQESPSQETPSQETP